MLPPNPIVQLVAIDTKYEKLKAIMAIQAQAIEVLQVYVATKKDPKVVEIMNHTTFVHWLKVFMMRYFPQSMKGQLLQNLMEMIILGITSPHSSLTVVLLFLVIS